jgi:hypothetical protein
MRDTKVLIDTLDQLIAGNGEQAVALDSTLVQQALQEDYQAIRCYVLADHTLESAQAILVCRPFPERLAPLAKQVRYQAVVPCYGNSLIQPQPGRADPSGPTPHQSASVPSH